MKKFSEYLINSTKFTKKYIGQYFKLLIKPIVIGIIGILSVSLVYIHPLLSILALAISIPCVCYSFWNGYVITYSLINVSNAFINGEEKELKDCLIDNEQKKQLALWLGFCALISILAFLPAMIFMGKNIDIMAVLTNPSSLLSNAQNLGFASLICLITTIILLPFLNFFNQALYFKKEKENFINTLLNCYKKLDGDGIKLSIIFTLIGGILSCFGYIYPILALILNLFTFSANTFWFEERIKETKEENTL